MLTSAVTGALMLIAVGVLLYLVTFRKMPFSTHQLYARLLADAFVLHGLWGLTAVFVLKS